MSDVTIVIPNYNGIAFLKTCLDSVLAQTGVQMDVIIIDNGSWMEVRSSSLPTIHNVNWFAWIRTTGSVGQSTKVSTGQKARMSYC